ncbi:MAG: hypothetical protein NVS2B3_08430 [Vulcanimicrobiaceae bacterium]
MQRFLALCAFLAAAAWAPAGAAEAPYAKLARALGTPDLAASSGPRDHSQMSLHFVRGGERYERWTKMTTVSIVRVPAAETDGATRGVIDRLRKRLASTHAAVAAFDRAEAPVSGYYAFRAKGESDIGIVYSPSPGFVTVAQLGARGGERISSADISRLRGVIGK